MKYSPFVGVADLCAGTGQEHPAQNFCSDDDYLWCSSGYGRLLFDWFLGAVTLVVDSVAFESFRTFLMAIDETTYCPR
jgi:hypothetical protein